MKKPKRRRRPRLKSFGLSKWGQTTMPKGDALDRSLDKTFGHKG